MMLPPESHFSPGTGVPGERAPDPGDCRGRVPSAPELDPVYLAGLAELAEPTEAELAGCWPDLFAGRPEGCEDWCADRPDDASSPVAAPGGWFACGRLLDELEPGPALAGLSQGVLDDGFGGLSDDELAGILRASRRLSSWQSGVELAAVAELDARRLRQSGRPGWSRVSEYVSSELAALLVLTGRGADGLLALARDLGRLPMVRNALLAGQIDRARAVVFAEELSGLSDVAAAAVAAGFTDLAGSMTTSRLRAALRAMVLSLDPAAARKRRQRGQGEARVECWQEGSGNAALAGRELPPGEAIGADKRITAIARALKDAGAPGTLDQLRAAVFTALLAGRDPRSLVPVPGGSETASGHVGAPQPAGPGALGALTGSVHLTMPAAAWLGLSDAPGEMAGLGPLDAWTCRDLASRLGGGPRTCWCVTLTRPDGTAAAHACARAGPGPPGGLAWLAGLRFDWLERDACTHARVSRRYQPGDRLRHLICARQRTCAFPGCRRAAARCDLDHTIPHDQGGPTCECNLSPACAA